MTAKSSTSPKNPPRCPWFRDGAAPDPLMLAYHDTEWGVPLHDDRKLFEFLVLDAFQAGLSWSTVLHKRAAFENAFDGFDPLRVARYDNRKILSLLNDSGIIRNKAKIETTITNSKAFLITQNDFGSFDRYIWKFVGGRPIVNRWKAISDMPATTAEAEAMSKDLVARGFRFVGPTICYAFMQAAGLVNDHTMDCFRHAQLTNPSR